MKIHSIALAGALPEESITKRNIKASLLQIVAAVGYYLGMIFLLLISLLALPFLVLLMLVFTTGDSTSYSKATNILHGK
jgi:hypothetical protein